MDSTDNKDLIWDLDGFQQRQLVAQFVQRFENKLCVYSGSVEQLYTSYNIFFPKDEGHKMVILPDPYAYHDTFQGVQEDAVRVTGLNIVPGELVGRKGLYLTVPVTKGGKKSLKVVPLQAGLQAINKSRPADNPFLPILMKGDLREFEERLPILHLHCIELKKLTSRSEFERNDIKRAIAEKLPKIS